MKRDKFVEKVSRSRITEVDQATNLEGNAVEVSEDMTRREIGVDKDDIVIVPKVINLEYLLLERVESPLRRASGIGVALKGGAGHLGAEGSKFFALDCIEGRSVQF